MRACMRASVYTLPVGSVALILGYSVELQKSEERSLYLLAICRQAFCYKNCRIEMKVVAVLCLLAAAALQVYALPTGAPSPACAAIQPGDPHTGTNPPNSANMSDVPFQLDLSQFRCPSSVAGYCYVPGATYRSKL